MTEEQTKYEVMASVRNSMLFDIPRYEHAQRVAKMLSTAELVPEHFRRSIGDCIIALNYADRVGMDPIFLMQKMYVVHGKPGVEAQLKIGMVNNCGRFSPIRWRHKNERTKDWTCTAYAIEKATKEELAFTLSWDTVIKERWLDKSGTKWKTMPHKMMQYRSASWWADLYCPEVVLGLPTRDELAEAIDVTPDAAGEYSAPVSTQDKLEALTDETPDPGQEGPPNDKPEFRCPYCEAVAKNKSGLTRHMNKCAHNPENIVDEPGTATTPPETPQDGTSGIDLYQHIADELKGDSAIFDQLRESVEATRRSREIWITEIMPKLEGAPIKAGDVKRLGQAVLFFDSLVDEDKA